ncbi:MAG: hypothetical protein RR376_20630, partial [Janthinobacterium sp.]
LMLSGKHLSAKAGLAAGLVDKLVEGEEKPAAYVPAPVATAPVAARKPAPALRPVKSLTRKTEAAAPVAAAAPRKAAAGGGSSNDEWEEF